MEIVKYDEIKNAWKQIARNKKSQDDFQFEIEVYKKLLSFFHIGPYYYYILNIANQKMEFVSESIKNVRGIESKEFSLDSILETVHPEDLNYFIAFEKKVADFFNCLKPQQVPKYKVSYDYRIKKNDGNYIRLLQQVTTIQSDESGAVIRVLGIHTDITHLKKENMSTLSFIGLEGEPSFIDAFSSETYMPIKEIFTKRERQILKLLALGKNTNQMADYLLISTHTVATHRKNMLQKTETHSIVDLVIKSINEGWI